MEIHYQTLETCAEARGWVVSIDVLRAFTTAAFAFAAGASEILLAGTVEEAFALRQRFPGSLLMGEVNALRIPGFDFGNSPAALQGVDLNGRRLIQRTSAGTQGVVLSRQAEQLLVASFVVAGATARYLQQQQPAAVHFVVTGILGPRDGDEDRACGEYIAALLQGEQPEQAPYLARARQCYSGQLFRDGPDGDHPAADLECALQVDRFDFALVVERAGDLHRLHPQQV